MPRAARPWFRFYVEAMRDPKLRRLTVEERWLWIAVLAAARESSVPGELWIAKGVAFSSEDLAEYAGMRLRAVEAGVTKMLALGMLTEGDALTVTAWSDRQYESDDVTARTRKHRSQEQDRNVPTSFVGTFRGGPDTDTDTDTEKINPVVERNGSSPSATELVFDAWRESTGRAKAVLDPKRRKLICAALKTYPPEDLCDAVRGWRLSPHHRGENDRHTVYNDLELLLRDAKQIERFRDLERHDPALVPTNGARSTREVIEATLARKAK